MSLLDANDHPPILSPLPLLTIPEDTPTNSIVAIATATDGDEGSNAELEYVIRAGNTGGVFGMRSDGSLIISTSLDHESVTLFNLVIEVRDGGTPQLIDSISVMINVTDVNDNAPQFIELDSPIDIPEVGTSILNT